MGPLVLQRDIGALKNVTPMSVITLIYMTVVIAMKAFLKFPQHRGHPEDGPLLLCKLDLGALEAFSLCIITFNCHINVVPVGTKLIRPTSARIEKVSVVVNLLQ